ncbi:TPA: hypothetical protein DEW47_03450 [Patescibacteria group bacterium]|nr:MAG: hypothetical protein UT71_C0001G0030 [Parcubacteria group bacterium GW2011_GWF2_40_10]KKR47886.1 MAG: hypothetical protein UT83_C0002G0017 [Parcubacteria group bacterium GW2011_GWA2_40_143]KKR60334.1 MAG: hypothetical protein UT97_C0002G0034 [Parcubacteria group bacterium GW2011_GWC2_40_31]KKR75314.1 MAG: hypothetical protein UU18_C0008G0004 [Parcubacteria group bacterium GW2011_GWB2_40_8]KKR76705.1 MAG: hypothetical protein UU20_C0020G0003 [Parcubacteria group bacterium GW2011_GWE2_40_
MSPVSSKSTQEFVPIKEIRDGVIILKDNSLRMILMASTLNFALKSEEEQSAIVLQYQNFLNSLDFPVQFFIQSRKLDIGPYLAILSEAEKSHDNELLRIQTKEYAEFVKNFVQVTNVMSKTFYITVPYTNVSIEVKKGSFGKLFGGIAGDGKSGSMGEKFEQYKIQLQQRSDVVQQGLARAGIRVAPLNTEELIELFYELYNPGESGKGVANR